MAQMRDGRRDEITNRPMREINVASLGLAAASILAAGTCWHVMVAGPSQGGLRPGAWMGGRLPGAGTARDARGGERGPEGIVPMRAAAVLAQGCDARSASAEWTFMTGGVGGGRRFMINERPGEVWKGPWIRGREVAWLACDSQQISATA